MGVEKRDKDNAYSGEVGCTPVSLEAHYGGQAPGIRFNHKQ